MQQHTFVAIDIGNIGLAGCSGRKTWVIGKEAMATKGAYVDNILASGAAVNGQLNGRFAVDSQGCFAIGHTGSSEKP